ncbi:MAG: hypothetical protein K8823_143 [Cenarchaeum symbiont of Oopsacas minuta]|nr:hypothetical protein [Cenarchaeum symbiont of Oopsacas minuta]
MQSPEEIREITRLRDKIEQKIDAAHEDLLFLEESLKAVDLLLKRSSFTKASSIPLEPENTKPKTKIEPETQTDDTSESIPMTNTSDGRVIANAYLTPDRLAIILNKDLDLEQTTPPFQTYFLDRVMADMKKKDAKVQGEDQKVMDYTINKVGSIMREIIIENYRNHQTAMEIINTATWSFNKMLEKTSR